jgi:hypothetical protein
MGATTKEKPAAKASAKKSTSAKKATGPTSNHPPKRRATLKRAGLSEQSELTAEQAKRADSASSKMSAERLSAYIMRGEGAKAAAAKSKYSAEVSAAAKQVREIIGPKSGAPGPKQVKRVATVLKDRDPVEASGISAKALKAYAEKKEKPKDTSELQALAREVKDPWATGRRLAAILVALKEARDAK